VSSLPANIAWLIGPLHQYAPAGGEFLWQKAIFPQNLPLKEILGKNE
jgi:hypothetical protein